ncbi:hypothetical protein ACFL33_05015 [Pseudomonadota bacterium]
MTQSIFELFSFAGYFATAHHQLPGLCDIVLRTAEEQGEIAVAFHNEREDFHSIEGGRLVLQYLSQAPEETILEFGQSYLASAVADFPELNCLEDENDWLESLADFFPSQAYSAFRSFGALQPKLYLDQELLEELYGRGLVLLAPFLYFSKPWIRSVHSTVSYSRLIYDHLTQFRSCTTKGLQLVFAKMGYFLSDSFIGFLVFNHPELFLDMQSGQAMARLIRDRWPDFELEANASSIRAIKKLTYSKLKEFRARSSVDDACGANNPKNLVALREELQVLVKQGFEYEKPKLLVQGMPDFIHERICSTLASRGTAMSYRVLCLDIGVKALPISPRRLGPGRILAYGRNPLFEKKENAQYVLREWVATASLTKGKIHPDRIITPLKEKDVEFSEDLLEQILSADVYLRDFGVVSSNHVAKVIASRLPGHPQELFYRTLIRDRLYDYFSEQYVFLGRGWFGQLLNLTARLQSESIRDFRLRYLCEAFGMFSTAELRQKVYDLAEDYPELLNIL